MPESSRVRKTNILVSILFDLHSWATAFAYPVINSILVVLSMWGFLKTKFAYQFALIGVSAGLSVLISTIFLILRFQKAFDVSILSKSTARAIWPLQAAGEYISMGLYLVGFSWLILSLTRAEKTNQREQTGPPNP